MIIRAGQLATVLLGVEHLELSGRFVLVESLIDHRGQANLLDVLFFLTQTSWPFLNTLRIHAKKHDIFNPSPASCIVCAVCADQMDAQSGSCGKFGGSSCSSGRLLSEVKTSRFYVYQPVSPWTSTFAKDQDLLHVPLAMMTTHRRGPRLVRVGSQ